MNCIRAIRPHIPANKFHPPRMAEDRMLVRSELLKEQLSSTEPYQYVFLEAQAGQGKTTTAIQLINHTGAARFWYQVGTEDRDPLFFYAALLQGMSQTVPGFSCPELEALLQGGEVTQADISRPINLLLTELERTLETGCTLVFDDLHLLEGSDHVLAIIDYILETAPPTLSFILLSRRPVALKSKKLRYGGSTLYLSNEDLAFSQQEVGALLSLLHGQPMDNTSAANLLAQTGGWVMAVALAARGRREGAGLIPIDISRRNDRLLTYLEEELFDGLSEELQLLLVKLSLLDVIVVELAQSVTGLTDISTILQQLMEDNCFVRSLDNDATQFSFHHHFRSLLRLKAEKMLPEDVYEDILLQGAIFSLEKENMLAAGMHYLLRARSYPELERLCSRRSMELVSMNRLVTIASILENIPADIVENSAWLSFLNGLTLRQHDPPKSLHWLIRSRSRFQEEKDHKGELLCLGELIFHHLVLIPDHESCTDYLNDAAGLFEEHGQELPSHCRANTAKNISSGFFYYRGDFNGAINYSLKGERAALEVCATGQLLENLVCRGFSYIFLGEFQRALDVAEQIYSILVKTSCGLFSLLIGHCFLFQMLYAQGDFQSYRRLKRRPLGGFEIDEINGTLAHGAITLYDVCMAIAGGDNDRALELINGNMEKGVFHVTSEAKNELLAIKVLILALSGRFISEGRELAEFLVADIGNEQRSPGYRLRLLGPISLSFALGGELKQARSYMELLFASIDQAVAFEMDARLIRIILATLDNNRETLTDDLSFVLEKLQKQKDNYSRWFPPSHLSVVLKLAVEHDIYREFARQLAAEHLGLVLTDNGDSIPLMRVKILGSFEIHLEGKLIGTASDFTLTQRQLLGLIMSQPRQQVSREQIQLLFWPDSSPEKGRNRFDVLLTRFRKSLAKLLKETGCKAKDYLSLKNGVLSLQNCTIDALYFNDLVRRGMALGRDNKWWQAGNCFLSALEQWPGPFAAELLFVEQSYQFADELNNNMRKIALSWCPALVKNGQREEALRVARLVQKENPDPEILDLLERLRD